MNTLDKMRQMAGIEVINEEMGSPTRQMAEKIFQLASKYAYSAGAEQQSMNDDDILNIAKEMLKEIEATVIQKIEAGRMDQDAEVERQMGADRNMEMGETNFKDPDRF